MDLFSGLVTHKRPEAPSSQPPKAQPPKAQPPKAQPPKAASLPRGAPTHEAPTQRAPERPSAAGGIATVGDGGASWKARALKRARQRASNSGESLSEVVRERFSSVEDLVQGSKRAAEPWRARRRQQDRGGKGFDDRGNASRRGESRGVEQRGGGLRIGREARDADIISRYRGKVRSSSMLMGVDEASPSVTTEGRGDGRGNISTKKRPAAAVLEDRAPSAKARHTHPLSITAAANATVVSAPTQPQPQPQPQPSKSSQQPQQPQPPPLTATPAIPPPTVSRPHASAAIASGGGSNSDAAALLRRSLSGRPSAAGAHNSNAAAAQALRARLLGNSSGPPPSQPAPPSAVPEAVAPFDSEGRRLKTLMAGHARDDAPQKEDFKTGRWKGKVKVGGSSSAVAAADADVDIMDMVAEEREGGVDMDEVFARNVVRLGGNYKGAETQAGSRAGFDEEEDVDMKMFATTASRMTAQKLQRQQKQQAVKEHNKAMQVMHTNPFSMENPNFQQHLVISRTDHAYVMLATRGKLVEKHCFIVPIKQVSSTRVCQEEVFEDMQNFKSSLRRMFGANGQGVVFIETAAQGSRQWGKIEAIPVPLECEMDAPLYFKQALADIDGRVIDLAEKTIRKAIPESFPYFSCEWARGGLALVIDDTERFQTDFGHSVLAGMMGLDPPQLAKKDGNKFRRMSIEQETHAVASFQSLLSGFL